MLRRLGVNISNDRLYKLSKYLRRVPNPSVVELQVSVATNFINTYWDLWSGLDKAIDRVRFPGLRFLRLRFLPREPVEGDLEWFFS